MYGVIKATVRTSLTLLFLCVIFSKIYLGVFERWCESSTGSQ